MRKITCAALTVTILFLFSVSILSAQTAVPVAEPKISPNRAKHESAKHPLGERLSVETADLASPPMKGVESEKKIARRLPTGYKDIVSNQQRDEIYKIQKDYGQIIEQLKIRVQLLERERDQKIDLLLNDEQVEKIKSKLGSLAFEKHLQLEEDGEVKPRRGRRATTGADDENDDK